MSDLQGFGFVLPHWLYWGWLAVMPLVMMYMARREAQRRPQQAIPDEETALDILAEEDPVQQDNGNRVTRVIDWISDKSGVFVAFWTVNAVVIYFYEVVMRYLFNMPTIWVHEASYLLFGMQYLLAGGFAMLYGAHVRVDIIYVKLPPRGRVGMDIFTSIFFFIFALALCATSWHFFTDSYQMGEVTMETWGIQHWPVKMMMFLGSALILMAGVSKLIKDLRLFIKMGEAQS
ncbi:MAG: TRAP transporter small permease subunit [Gammaproteobacteria bacterium]|nr:TRAP transporter small permease subunit [Gammaproteobacteria bacterium]